MPSVGLEPKITSSEREKAVHSCLRARGHRDRPAEGYGGEERREGRRRRRMENVVRWKMEKEDDGEWMRKMGRREGER
jgi:hypothetical protein